MLNIKTGIPAQLIFAPRTIPVGPRFSPPPHPGKRCNMDKRRFSHLFYGLVFYLHSLSDPSRSVSPGLWERTSFAVTPVPLAGNFIYTACPISLRICDDQLEGMIIQLKIIPSQQLEVVIDLVKGHIVSILDGGGDVSD